ncbi:hypothetical protein AVEN_180724-1 [Araneus ventricosus]|uniref:Uncharacterized protein n=1 Tax=Araneus ventricosus TaxID=182803 RepID=A0A4Y2FXX9_ARAVE|nr:hypothetical protein AVEN_180724-1 [Araneus ventricosus]
MDVTSSVELSEISRIPFYPKTVHPSLVSKAAGPEASSLKPPVINLPAMPAPISISIDPSFLSEIEILFSLSSCSHSPLAIGGIVPQITSWRRA